MSTADSMRVRSAGARASSNELPGVCRRPGQTEDSTSRDGRTRGRPGLALARVIRVSSADFVRACPLCPRFRPDQVRYQAIQAIRDRRMAVKKCQSRATVPSNPRIGSPSSLARRVTDLHVASHVISTRSRPAVPSVWREMGHGPRRSVASVRHRCCHVWRYLFGAGDGGKPASVTPEQQGVPRLGCSARADLDLPASRVRSPSAPASSTRRSPHSPGPTHHRKSAHSTGTERVLAALAITRLTEHCTAWRSRGSSAPPATAAPSIPRWPLDTPPRG